MAQLPSPVRPISPPPAPSFPFSPAPPLRSLRAAPVLPWDAEDRAGPYETDAVRPPGVEAPATREVPRFPPVRVRGGRCRPPRLARHRGRAVAAGLAVTAAALVAAGPRAAEQTRAHPLSASPPSAASPHTSADALARERHGVETVAAPVRIADAATVRLLRPGDRVDVVASDGGGRGRLIATGARVSAVPDAATTETGALVVLSVPRPTAVRLAGAGTAARLAVTLC